MISFCITSHNFAQLSHNFAQLSHNFRTTFAQLRTTFAEMMTRPLEIKLTSINIQLLVSISCKRRTISVDFVQTSNNFCQFRANVEQFLSISCKHRMISWFTWRIFKEVDFSVEILFFKPLQDFVFSHPNPNPNPNPNYSGLATLVSNPNGNLWGKWERRWEPTHGATLTLTLPLTIAVWWRSV